MIKFDKEWAKKLLRIIFILQQIRSPIFETGLVYHDLSKVITVFGAPAIMFVCKSMFASSAFREIDILSWHVGTGTVGTGNFFGTQNPVYYVNNVRSGLK